ncbi:chemotaxis response regulator protein-glutamate methylesterase [Clostridium sp. JS66]|uniref:protein-glutamate methylesterase/protein-glutamine glutaminase n=1 Tax=Clostridium sp. JS66 TaxID=3064705 RepID=UPI00298DCE5C|nr:chemotaxis response regulator protein-glutamate methylesterase [Clostridium sp. JS66]WPC43455.1 chemotaxis response regulator protein-glutamate methylesterase [Clostridium sp. JS66]
MYKSKKVRVLVVDDSLIFRETVAKGIAKDRGIEVVGTASDPFDARDKIIEYEPDVITLDVEMPKMNGIEFLKRLMPQYPLPVVVVSAVSSNVFDALNAGAVDFVTKPDGRSVNGLEGFIKELVTKIKIASVAKVAHWKKKGDERFSNNVISSNVSNKIIAIGSSTGGTEAVATILKMLPKNIPPIVVVQHMPPVFTRMYAERLNNSCPMEVREAKNGDRLYNGLALIAPGEYHMSLEKRGTYYYVKCFKGEKVNGHCPAVDVLFESVAKEAGKNAIGIILTGMGYDGAKGLLSMKKRGAITIGQNEESCVVYGMPKVAYDIGAVQKQVSIENIAGSLGPYLNRSNV